MSLKNRLLHLKHNGSLTENDYDRLIISLELEHELEQEIKDLIEDYKDLSDILVKHKKAIKILKAYLLVSGVPIASITALLTKFSLAISSMLSLCL